MSLAGFVAGAGAGIGSGFSAGFKGSAKRSVRSLRAGAGVAGGGLLIQDSSSSLKKSTCLPTLRGLMRPLETQLRSVPSVTFRYLAASL